MQRPIRLYLITDPAAGDSLVVSVARALSATGPHGCDVAVQLRAKGWPTARLLTAARALRAVTREHASRLLINDRADVARLCEADGVHLPETGLSVSDARACLVPGSLVGRSCHDAHGLAHAAEAGADFATLSPVHEVPGKGPALGLAGFERLCHGASLPVIALGGVTAADSGPLLRAGASGVAAMRSILGAPDPALAMTAWVQELFDD